jgi:4'-phosphopantetheinyl transferase
VLRSSLSSEDPREQLLFASSESMAEMDVYWLEQSEADVPRENQWLSARELLVLDGMRFAKRRNDWRLGRWTAKRTLAACLNLSRDLPALAHTEILAAPSGAPEVFLLNQPAPVTISLSHRAGIAICAVAHFETCIGCDLEMIEGRGDAFTADYFTVNERAKVERTHVEARPLLVTLLWSAKESVLKALHVGLRLDTTCLDVSFVDDLPPCPEHSQYVPIVHWPAVDPDAWHPLHVRYSSGQIFTGWWQNSGQMVRTVVSALPLRPPVRLAFCSNEAKNCV